MPNVTYHHKILRQRLLHSSMIVFAPVASVYWDSPWSLQPPVWTEAAGVVLLLHSGYVSMPTDFGVSWRRDFTRHTQNHTATIFVQCLGASFSAQVWRLVRELDERFSYSTRKSGRLHLHARLLNERKDDSFGGLWWYWRLDGIHFVSFCARWTGLSLFLLGKDGKDHANVHISTSKILHSDREWLAWLSKIHWVCWFQGNRFNPRGKLAIEKPDDIPILTVLHASL